MQSFILGCWDRAAADRPGHLVVKRSRFAPRSFAFHPCNSPSHFPRIYPVLCCLTVCEMFRSLRKQEFINLHLHFCLGTEPISMWVCLCCAWPPCLAQPFPSPDCHISIGTGLAAALGISHQISAADVNFPCSLKLFSLSVMSESQRPCSEMSHCLCFLRGISGQGLQLKVSSDHSS